MNVQPYVFFDGRCDEALAFYKQALGAKTEALMRFKENPDPQTGCGPDAGDIGEKVMHANMRIGETQIMVSDGMCTGNPAFEGIALSITYDDDTKIRQHFDALADGGEVTMPLGKTFFGRLFGMVKDRFGVSWMLIIPSDGEV